MPRSVLGHMVRTCPLRGQIPLRIECYPQFPSPLHFCNLAGRIPLAKDRGRHYCIGTHLSTKMADSVENRMVPAVSIPSTLYCAEEVPTHDEVGRTKPCVNMLFLPLQSCTVEHMAKVKVWSERTESLPIEKITPVIDEEPL